MTPKEKADELFKEFMHYVDDSYNEPKDMAISCVLIVVDEILNMSYPSSSFEDLYCHLSYWNEVKKEIEKL